MNLLDIGNNVRNYLRQGALNLGFKPLKDNSLGANLRGIGQAGQISTNFAQQKVNNFAQPAYNIPIAGGVVKGIVNQPFNYASSAAQFLQNPNVKTGASFLGQGVNTATMVVSPTGLSFKAGQRIVPQLPNIARQSFLKIGLPSGAGGALDTYGRGGNAGDVAKSFALNTALGTGAGVGFPLAGRGIGNAMNRINPKPVLVPRNSNIRISNSPVGRGIEKPLEVKPNLIQKANKKPISGKIMRLDDIRSLDDISNLKVNKAIDKEEYSDVLAELMDRNFTKAQIDNIPRTDKAWTKALNKKANQTEATLGGKTNQSFLKISNPKDNPLTQEARKYKSAEEFVKAQGTLYHGSTGKPTAVVFNEDKFLTYDKNVAKQYGKVSEYVTANLKIATESDLKKLGLRRYSKAGEDPIKHYDKFITTLKKNGFDGIDNSTENSKIGTMGGDPESEVKIWNKDKLMTKSQLTDIWNKANKPTVQGGVKIGSVEWQVAKETEAIKKLPAGTKTTYETAYGPVKVEVVKRVGSRWPEDKLSSMQVKTTEPMTVIRDGKQVIRPKGTILRADPIRLVNNINTTSTSQPIKIKPTVEPKTEQPFLKISNPSQTPKPKQRGFVSSVKESQNVTKPTKNITIGGYNSKTNDSLMAEAKALLTEGAEVDFSKVKNVDQKVAATIQEALNLDKAGKHNEAAALFNNLAKYGTELGRGVQAFNMLDKMSPEAITKSAARTIQKYNETAGRKIPELTGTQQKLISGAVEKIRGMKDGREKNLAINELQQTINSFVPSTLVDKAITVWKAGLLTSLRTHERNLLGNTVMQVSEAVKNPIAAGADAIMSTFTGQRTKTATARGLQDAFSKQTRQQFVDKAKLGFDPSNEIAGFDVKKVNWNTKNPVEAVLKKYTNAVFNTLSASDTPFFNASFANSLYDQAGAIAINSGKRGNKNFIDSLVKSPTAEMLTQATKDAQYATFKDKNVLSGLAGNIKRKLAEQGGLKGEAGKIIGELTMPFTGVPSSIVAKTVAYSPIGLIKGATTAGRVVTGRVPELQRQASEEIARGVIGTGLFGLGSYLMSKGLMTGQPKDSKEADQWAIEGKQANSVDLFGKWRSINSIGPQNLVILAGAKYNEEMNDPEGGLGSFATKLGKDQLGQTFVQGMSGPINALTDPNRYGKSYVGSTVSSVVPNIVKDIAKSQDQYARETNTTTDYLKQGIPFARNTLLPRRNNIGDVIPQEPTGAGAFLDIFNSKSPVKNKVVDELARLNNVGFEATPSKLKKDQTIQGVKKTLTPQELDTLEAQTGPVLNETLNRLVESEYYKNLDDEAKSKAIDKVVTDIRKKVKGAINLSGNTLGDINTEITQTKAPTVGQYEILNPETNKIKTIDIETPIEKPVLTGNTALDKKLISKFNSKLTSRANDIVALYEDGQIDGKTAESELTKLTTLKSSTGKGKKGKKPKKITIKKIAGARKITNIKIGKSSSLKPIKIKKLKLKSAKKVKKVGNIKIANYKLPKIKIS